MDISNSSYEELDGNHSVERDVQIPHSRGLENLISIDTSDEDDENNDNEGYEYSSYNKYPSLHSNGTINQTEEEFNVQINRLKEQSTKRFRSKWEEILQKYSEINDERESDEIDLASGEIITDNGHLKSLRSSVDNDTNSRFDGDIWSVTYDLERDLHNKKVKESRLRQKKKHLKYQLKAQEMFHNTSLQSSPLKADDLAHNDSLVSLTDDNLLSLNPSPTKRPKLSPTKRVRYSSPVRRDENSLLTPTKRKAESRYGPAFTTKLFFEDSSNDNTNNSDYKEDFTCNPFDTSNISRGVSSMKKDISQNVDDSSNMTSTTESGVEVETSETSDIGSGDNKITNTLDRLPQIFRRDIDDESDAGIEQSLDFDDQFLIVTDTRIYPYEKNSAKIYNCAVEDCHYCTGNKLLYQKHLLDRHSNILKAMGYPIENEITPTRHIPKQTILKIIEHFPLIFEVPRLPLSKTGEPFVCGLEVENSKRCTKFFITKEDLHLHQANTKCCSSKKKVLICPMLGCGYMTDVGYLEWRSHFIEKKHHIDPRHRLTAKDKINSIYEDNKIHDINLRNLHLTTKPMEHDRGSKLHEFESTSLHLPFQSQGQHTIRDPIKEINDIFSDSGSEISLAELYSDDENVANPRPELEMTKIDACLPEHSREPTFSIQSELHAESMIPFDEDLNTGHESIEELFDD